MRGWSIDDRTVNTSFQYKDLIIRIMIIYIDPFFVDLDWQSNLNTSFIPDWSIEDETDNIKIWVFNQLLEYL